MLYDVLVVSNGGGGKRFTTERDASLSVGDTFEQDSELYRVLAIQTGHGPFDYVVEVEWLTNVGPSDFEPALVLGQRRSAVLRACVRSSTAPEDWAERPIDTAVSNI